MKTNSALSSLTVLLAIALQPAQAATAHPQDAAAHDAHQHAVAAAPDRPAPAKRWVADAPLRAAMVEYARGFDDPGFK